MAITPPLHTVHGWQSSMRDLLLARREDDSRALWVDDQTWTWPELLAASAARAAMVTDQLDGREPPHVGVLLDNGPEFVFQLAAASLAGYVLVGLNPTRPGSSLERDATFTQCQVVLTDEANAHLLEGLDLGAATSRLINADDPTVGDRLADHDGTLPEANVQPSDVLVLTFTSGTTGEPKAVVCTTGRLAHLATMLAELYGFRHDDVLYLSMPLFHSGAVMAGVAPAIKAGATMVVARSFSASGFMPDIRRYGATLGHYVGKPLSYVLAQPEHDDDRDHDLRLLVGNEAAPAVIDRFEERFGCRVRDGYGSSEGGIRITRPTDTPRGALGRAVGDIRVLDPTTGRRCPAARRDEQGRLVNAAEAVGEFVNWDGFGTFEGYWNNPEAAAERMKDGRFHSGDLGYIDTDGWMWFAGRTTDWLRVDGENFGAAQVAEVARSHPDVIDAVAYGVPDTSAGDQVMLAVELAGGPEFDGRAWARWWIEHPDASPKWIPRYVRIMRHLPHGASNKVQVHDLAVQGLDPTGEIWWSPSRGEAYRPLTRQDHDEIVQAIVDSDRGHLLAR